MGFYYGWASPEKVSKLTYGQMRMYWEGLPDLVKEDAEVRAGPIIIVLAKFLEVRLSG